MCLSITSTYLFSSCLCQAIALPFIPLLPCLLEFPQCLIMCCLHMMHFHRINQARKGSRRSVSIEPMPLVCKQSPLSTELPQPHFRLVYRIYCILTLCCSVAASDYCSLNTCNFIFIDIPSELCVNELFMTPLSQALKEFPASALPE